jgi:hypothetical protein
MAEKPFFSPNDDEWLEEILGKLGDGEMLPDDDSPQAPSNDKEEDYSDLEDLTPAQKKKFGVLNAYFRSLYLHTRPLQMPDNLDTAAIQMMRTLAFFKEHATFRDSQGTMRIGDKFPDLSVSDANLVSRHVLKEIAKELSDPLQMETMRRELLSLKSSYSVLSAISGRAAEMEERRRKGPTQ